MDKLSFKHLYALLLLFIAVGYASAQPRVDRAVEAELLATTSKLKNTTMKGYHYDESSGKWREAKGEVPGLGDMPDFKTMEVRVIGYNDSIYYMLTIKERMGTYDYPNLKIGYHSFFADKSYYFSEEEFSKLFDMKIGQVYAICSYNERYTGFSKSTLENFPQLIRPISEYYGYIWMVKLSDEGLIRFRIPQEVGSRFYPEKIETDYFEVTAEKFYKWLEPVIPQ